MFYPTSKHLPLLALLATAAILLCNCSKQMVMSESAGSQTTVYEQSRTRALKETRVEDSNRLKMALKTAQNTPMDRMIHHDGFIHLRTPRPRHLADEATRIVKAHGGYVERMESGLAIFRIPLKTFQVVFNQMLSLGDVIDKSIETEDITDAFMDVDLRLNIARTARKRLMELLAKAEDEKQKIRILKEIQRLSIRIESLSAQRATMLTKASYSTIKLKIEMRRLKQTSSNQEKIDSFEWIYRLSPFEDQVAHTGKPLKFKVPADMVRLPQKKIWIAESADGAFVRASRHFKQPMGDTDFWVSALKRRISTQYAHTQLLEAGRFKVLRFEDRSETPYIYLVGLNVTQKQILELVEIYYPTSNHEKRYKEKVFASLKGGVR